MKIFGKSAKEEGEEAQKKAEKSAISRNAFPEDPFSVSLVVEVVPAILFMKMAKTSYNKKWRNLFLVSL